MKHYLESSSTVLDELSTSQSGLSENEAAKRLEANGKNKLVEGKKESLIHRFFKQLAEPSRVIGVIVGNEDVFEIIFSNSQFAKRGKNGVFNIAIIACRIKKKHAAVGHYEIHRREDIFVRYAKRVYMFVDLF